MHIAHTNAGDPVTNLREKITAALNHLDHVLPGQGPILDFVHHNTLHGYQHLPFEDALAANEALTGTHGYLPETQSRTFYQQGRIDDSDIFAALAHGPQLQAEQIVCQEKDRTIRRKDIYRIALLFDLQPLTVSQFNWQMEELNAMGAVQADVPEQVRNQLLATGTRADNAVRQLWISIVTKLDLEQTGLHPENLLDLSLEQAEEWLESTYNKNGKESVHQQMQQQANESLDKLLDQLGDSITLRGFILALSGTDILDFVRPQLIRICASCMDEGIAAWRTPERSCLGLYASWRATAQYDANPYLHELPNWQAIMAELPVDAVDTIILQLTSLEIPQEKWEGYLQRLALELPGWSGLINWRQHHPKYYAPDDAKPNLADYLAIRLTLDRLWLNQVCRENWLIEARLSSLQTYFRKNLSEFIVRSQLYQGDLPEYLTRRAESQIRLAGSERHERADWQQLADLIQTWQSSPLAEQQGTTHTIYSSGWRLFRLCQHLGLDASYAQEFQKQDLLQMLTLLDQFTLAERGKVWLYAYERHYADSIFQAIRANHKQGRWEKRDKRPDAQIVFCMDEREESVRRHLEELNPAIETLGAAGFFGVPMNYKGLDDHEVTPLCPLGVIPTNDVNEIPKEGSAEQLAAHNKGRGLYGRLVYLLHQNIRRNLLLSHAAIDLLAPFTLLGLLGKALVPKQQQALVDRLRRALIPKVATKLQFTAEDVVVAATPDHPSLGFTDQQQADRVAGLLRTTGLTYGFAPIVCLMAHGSTSQNNPHEAAHDCGACGGKRGGPNARVFAAMANRPEIRQLLAERGIHIPEDCRFVGAQHDTCSDNIIWYDLEDMPTNLLDAFDNFKSCVLQARELSAQERCRRFVSANNPSSPSAALQHVTQRAQDLSQVRPEYGHATNAAAVIGRRTVTQGIFLDRRMFLISYDATQDPDGKIIENILLVAGPVGAGISLEYYFSTIDNERFGCGTKVPHNVTGMFGVMEGASSDLRTGLPRQMVEIHEPMRLQIIVEAKTEILGQIYARQEGLRELIAGGWVHLSAIDPDSGDISIFERGIGFVPWQAEIRDLPVCKKSTDYFRNQTQPLPPALIRQPQLVEA